MKIGLKGINTEPGKVKYLDEKFIKLCDKCKPKKLSPYFVEFIDDLVQADGLACSEDKLIDIIIQDIEKCEARLERSTDANELELIKKCITTLENQTPVSQAVWTPAESEMLRALAPLTYKPCFVTNAPDTDAQQIIVNVLKLAGRIFFYTAGPKEVHAWIVDRNSDIVTCAGKIHSDLARGFIKGEIVSFENFMKSHNMNECRANGHVKEVDRDYLIEDGDIIEIRFNV